MYLVMSTFDGTIVDVAYSESPVAVSYWKAEQMAKHDDIQVGNIEVGKKSEKKCPNKGLTVFCPSCDNCFEVGIHDRNVKCNLCGYQC